jgi:hypothetical protein
VVGIVAKEGKGVSRRSFVVIDYVRNGEVVWNDVRKVVLSHMVQFAFRCSSWILYGNVKLFFVGHNVGLNCKSCNWY